jgi:hypothetical protein
LGIRKYLIPVSMIRVPVTVRDVSYGFGRDRADSRKKNFAGFRGEVSIENQDRVFKNYNA